MEGLLEKISESELKILRNLWDTGSEMTLAEVIKAASETTDWEPSTIKTLLYRLCKKGVVRQERRNVHYFSPLVSQEQYGDYATKTVIDNLYEGSAKNLVCALLDRKHLTEGEIDALRELFRVGAGKEGG